MPAKSKTNQPETPNEVQGRDLFQTPRFATELLLPYIPSNYVIWECACGDFKISDVLIEHGCEVMSTDLRYGDNFLTSNVNVSYIDAIVTNPPFSLKEKFFYKCLEYNIPFALLIPADYSLWTIDAIRKYGCQKLVPSRRIDYITPNGKLGKSSHGQFHSMWLCKDFNLPQQETFVELTNKMKENI